MPINFLSSLFKGKKDKPNASAAPAPEAAPAPSTASDPASLQEIGEAQVRTILQSLPEITLPRIMDDMSNRLIAHGCDPYLKVGMHLQDLRDELHSEDSPFMDFDAALITAVDQLEHICEHAEEAFRNGVIGMLDSIFACRRRGAPTARREVYEMKECFLKAQLITQKGQLFQSEASIRKYRQLLLRYQNNPASVQGTQIRLFLEHSEKMERVFRSNIDTLINAIADAEQQKEISPMESIDPSSILTSTREIMNEQQQVFEQYLRQMSSTSEILKEMSSETTKLAALEKATMQKIEMDQQQISMEIQLRRNNDFLAKVSAPTPVAEPAPISSEPATIAEEEVVEEIEEPTPQPHVFGYGDF